MDVDGEGLGSGTRAAVRVRFSARCMGRQLLSFELVSRFNFRMMDRLSFSVMVKCG